MKDKKYVIVDIHPDDSFYENKDELLGLVLIPDSNWHDSTAENDPLLKEDGKYMAGGATLNRPLAILNGGKWIYFYGVMVITYEEAMKS